MTEFKDLRVLFVSEDKLERQINSWIGAADDCINKRAEPKHEAPIYELICIRTPPCGHDLRVVAERI